MHKKEIMTVISNEALTKDVFKILLKGNLSEITTPGQFVDIALDGFTLRRPISVCDAEDDVLTLIYKTVGEGTRKMSELTAGATLDILTGLGQGYDTKATVRSALLLGGGVGVPPLYMLAKRLLDENKHVTVIMGFNTADEIFYEKEFNSLGVDVIVTTVDGSYGKKGFVTDVIETAVYDYFYACGPLAMLKAVEKATKTQGQISLEERMGCGFGACLGCSIQTVNGIKRVCKEGPVFKKGEVIW